MDITVKSFATLKQYQPENGAFQAPEGATVADVMQALGVPDNEVHIVFVNGRHAAKDAVLSPGDQVGLFPAVGGG
jgi:sulfur carrier protein ThiS